MDRKDGQPKGASKPRPSKTQTETPETGGPNSPAAAPPTQDEAAKRESNRKGGYGTG